MIGAEILKSQLCGKPPLRVHRSQHLKQDTGADQIVGKSFKTYLPASVSDLGLVEINEISGKRVRHTIQVRSYEPIFAAVPQENAEEDVIEWDGGLWRVVSVRRLNSTWRATAVRTNGKKDFAKDEAHTSTEPPRVHIV